jgi:hypothetical protein
MIGEIGVAILKIQRQAAGGLPAETAKSLESCMDHVKKVRPDINHLRGSSA